MNTKVEYLKNKAVALVASRSTASLLAMFELTELSTKRNVESAMVRGWIMDELQRRDPAAFDAWLDSDDDLPNKYFA